MSSTPNAPVSLFRSDLPLEAKLERARTDLLDLSARNRLLNVPRFSKGAKTVDVEGACAAETFRLLVRESRALSFAPVEEKDGSQPADAAPAKPARPEPSLRGGRQAEAKLQTRMAPANLQKRLLDLYTDARVMEEEQGVNVLFLALGMLRWADPGHAETPRHAPLVLVPVRLQRATAGARFTLHARPEDVAPNLCLEAYLERAHGLSLPPFDAGDAFDYADYIQAVTQAMASKTAWAVRGDDIALGFFSYAKFLMYRDLDPETWPAGGRMTDHPLIRSLLSEGFGGQGALLPDTGRIDAHIGPADMLHIVDCDSSQALAVHEARRGRNLVIQGPPGTGKSQVIANIVASAVADGKTVLFVAEKMAALDVVKRRLDQAGVGDACLELHSNKTSKRAVLKELERAWELGDPSGGEPAALLRRLAMAQDDLNAHADRMHRPHPAAGVSAFEVFGQVTRLRQDGVPPPAFVLEAAATWTAEEWRQRRQLAAELASRVRRIGQPDEHPWRGVGLDAVTPVQVDRLMQAAAALQERLTAWTAERAGLAAALRLKLPEAFSDTAAVATLGKRVASAPALDAAALSDPAWEAPCRIVALLEAGREHQRLSLALQGTATEAGLRAPVNGLVAAFSALPPGFSAEAFERAPKLRDGLQPLLDEAERLRALLGLQGGADTKASIQRLLAIAERVVAAPDASPEAFAASVWDHGAGQGGDLAEAVATLEAVQREHGGRFADAAWNTDVAAARQALAVHTGMFRTLKRPFRQAMAVARIALREAGGPQAGLLAPLDALMRGQAALRVIREGEAFGRAAFGADWRGEKSEAAPLLALAAWMRSLRGLGSEPRLIAGRMTDRPALENRLAAARRRFDEMSASLDGLWADLGDAAAAVFGEASSVEGADLAMVAKQAAAIASADEQSRSIMPGASLPQERLAGLRLIQARQAAGRELAAGAAAGRVAFGGHWQDFASDWAALGQAARWVADNADIRLLAAGIADRAALGAAAETVAAGLPPLLHDAGALFAALKSDAAGLFGVAALDALPAARLSARLSQWRAFSEELSNWAAYGHHAGLGRAQGLGAAVDRLHDGRLAPDDVVPQVEMAYHDALLDDLIRLDPALGRFDGAVHDSRVREFKSLDRQRIEQARLQVQRAHRSAIPSRSGAGPEGLIQGEIARKRGHMPIRQLMQRAAPAVQKLKPVLMMSPLSVAQFLPPGQMQFDLLVMDEASQIQPVDALGAIRRCRQVVVVGDERQLPPTQFFAKMMDQGDDDDDDDEAGVSDIESILGLFMARGLPYRMLRWHYRSRHQSLIAVSNQEFYDSRLYVVPSPMMQGVDAGLSFHPVADGVFASGGAKSNVAEAAAVAKAVMRHARERPALSLGVVAFSVSQRLAIQDEVERLRREEPEAEGFFQAHAGEPFFIKNLENVQGDERDVIMISVGYGRNAQGGLPMRFGPLGAEGGERRLNVLISRAKSACQVFASMDDRDIDLERAKGKGVAALKTFLQYARTGRLSLARPAGRGHDSVFEEQVARSLRKMGYDVRAQIGIAGFFIDLAIADPARPGQYLLGIECDGASYHSSRSARDRDRLRQAVLENHGWTIHRIWSTDWFQRPQEQLTRTAAAIEAAKERSAEHKAA